jgi:hypothetical protein
VGAEHGVGSLRKVFVSRHRQPLIRSELTFLNPGGSITTCAMHLASRQWYYSLGAYGVPAVSMLAQRIPPSVAKQNRGRLRTLIAHSISLC